jgi:Cu(I)/Ag(I) efflux system membrane fusion protein
MTDLAPSPHQARSAAPGDDLPEGAEAPPPGVRTMAIVRWALVALMAVAAAAAWTYWADVVPAAARGVSLYRCPMHPSIVQERPGACPVCGMDLVAAAAAGEPGPPAPATAPGASAGQGAYWCPMHPEVASDDPEARCEKCGGMKLLPRDGAAKARGQAVPGLAAVEIGPERTQLIGLRTAPVAPHRLLPRLRTVGFVTAKESAIASVTARFTGWIEELHVTETGQRVEKGQALATVYSTELQSAQQAYLTALRAQGAVQRTTAYPGSLDPGKRLASLGIAKEDIERITQDGQALYDMPIRAPISGYVARKNALAGTYVQPGAELFQIVDLSKVWVLADVYENEASRVRVGQKARLALGALPGETFTGRVQFVYPAVNAETRTLQVRIELRNPGLKLRPGMYGDVEVELPAVEGLAVPSEAVVDTGELQYVFVARDAGRLEPRVVRVGLLDGDRIQVLDGLAEGERVVANGNFLVDSESRMRAAVEGFERSSPQKVAEKH